MFLVNMLAKMKQDGFGSRIAEVHNGSSLFTGDAGQGQLIGGRGDSHFIDRRRFVKHLGREIAILALKLLLHLRSLFLQ